MLHAREYFKSKKKKIAKNGRKFNAYWFHFYKSNFTNLNTFIKLLRSKVNSFEEIKFLIYDDIRLRYICMFQAFIKDIIRTLKYSLNFLFRFFMEI